MEETIDIHGIRYKIEHMENEIRLSRYNEKYNMWVLLRCPQNTKMEGNEIEKNILESLSNLYIERNIFGQENNKA